jgi:hypothetical protein
VGGARLRERRRKELLLREKREERLADERLRPGGEQALGGGVRVAHDELVVERDHRGRQHFEARERSH